MDLVEVELDTTHCAGALAHQRQMGAGLALEHTRDGDLQLLLRVGAPLCPGQPRGQLP